MMWLWMESNIKVTSRNDLRALLALTRDALSPPIPRLRCTDRLFGAYFWPLACRVQLLPWASVAHWFTRSGAVLVLRPFRVLVGGHLTGIMIAVDGQFGEGVTVHPPLSVFCPKTTDFFVFETIATRIIYYFSSRNLCFVYEIVHSRGVRIVHPSLEIFL